MNYAQVLFNKKIIQIYIILIFIFSLTYLFHLNNALARARLKRLGREYLQNFFNTNDSEDLKLKTKQIYECLEKARMSPLIIVGGYGRSGTTLMRTILDAHSDVSCGPETKILPGITSFVKNFEDAENATSQLNQAGFSLENLNNALSIFLYHVMDTRGLKSKRLCAKDPVIITYLSFLVKIFPKAKFVYMVRDGRDSAYSWMQKRETFFTFENMKKYLKEWNELNEQANAQCLESKDNCIKVKYEDLIRNPKQNILKVATFLNLTWTDDFLRHNELIGSKITVLESEWSANQVNKPIYTSSINKWIGKIAEYNKTMVSSEIFMLKELGYDPEL